LSGPEFFRKIPGDFFLENFLKNFCRVIEEDTFTAIDRQTGLMMIV
jgi:hypothetical protein